VLSPSESWHKDSKATFEEQEQTNDPVKELLIIGAGPHALTLLLRLLEPDPDFLSDMERHKKADFSSKMRPARQVYKHITDISRGPKATLRLKKVKQSDKSKGNVPPPISLQMVQDSIHVVDAHGDWLACWKKNFNTLGIPQLRSLMNAHADPFDHRSLEYYAEVKKRGDELVTLPELAQRNDSFRGPYQAPSTRLFHDFHNALVQSYGISDIVQKGKVLSITPMKDPCSDENIFKVQICHGEEGITTVRTRRCVCALGPTFSKCKFSWETKLEAELGQSYSQISKRILRYDDILEWIQCNNEGSGQEPSRSSNGDGERLLVVGGGITSAQLVLRAVKDPFWKSVFFAQRSQTLIRHFDVENEWMGPKRGKVLERFFSIDMEDRAKMLREARKGGSIPPELFNEIEILEQKGENLVCEEEIEVSRVDWIDQEFRVTFDDDSTVNVDYVWLVTGCQNVIEKYPVLNNVRETLPVKVINGLPVLSQDLSWASTSEELDEFDWKGLARKRLWCMGPLAGLWLGADALNIVGARHGAVNIAKAIREDMRSN
jgi:hypothetical protein